MLFRYFAREILATSVLMLLAIIWIAYYHQSVTGLPSFDLADLLAIQISPDVQTWLFLAFAVAFWFSFFGHRYITFQKQGAASKFLLVALFSLAVRNLILSGLLFAGLSGLLPVVIATLTVTVLTYVLSRIWVFA